MSYAYNDRRNGYGNTGMVLGLLAGVLSLIPVMFYVALPIAGLAVICGLIGRSRVKRGSAGNNGAAVTGVAIGVLAVAVTFWTSARVEAKARETQQARNELADAAKEAKKSLEELGKAGAELGTATKDLGSAMNTPPSLPTSPPTSSSTPVPPPAAPSGSRKKIAEFSGTGAKQTAKFTVGQEWEVAWSYDCTGIVPDTKAAGVSLGMFMLDAESAGPDRVHTGSGVMQTGQMKGADVQSYHKGGEFYLDVGTMCRWTAVVNG